MQSGLIGQSRNLVPRFGQGQRNGDRYEQIFHFFGLRENPFSISPDPRYMSVTRQTQEALDAIIYGIQTRQGLMLLTGEVGTGKTTLTNYLLNWLRQQQMPTSFIFNPRLNVADLFDLVLADFGIACESKQKSTRRALLTAWLLIQHHAGKSPILIVDEAQGLPWSCLEEIRLLLNLETSQDKLLQIVLVGQPELDEKFAMPELRQLRQRAMVRCKIGPLSSVETRGYIRRRLQVAGAQNEAVFPPDAMDAVHCYSGGIPRLINILCEHALINSYADQIPSVTPQIVREVAHDFQFDKIAPRAARSDLTKTGSRGTITRSITTAARAHSVGASESASIERRDTSTNHALSPAVDKKSLAPAVPTIYVGIANTNVAERFSPWRWMASPRVFMSSYPWLRWLNKSITILRSHHAVTSVVSWLQRPIRPGRARRRYEQGQTPGALNHEITFARIQGDLRKGFARFWHDMKLRS